MASSGAATARVPADVEARIQFVAQDYVARGRQRALSASMPANPILARVSAENDRRIAVSRMASVVIAAITTRPDLSEALLGRVAAVAPDLGAGVRDRVSLAFPFRVGLAAPPAARAPPRPPPGPPRTARPSTTFADDEDEEAAAAAELAADEIAPEHDDPMEGFNRAVFWVNDMLDQLIFRPIAWTYGKLMPEPAKQGVRNVARNLKGPVILVNDLLQAEFDDAAITAARFLANSTLGLGGLFDVAGAMGLEHHPADFGQTLHAYGVGSGPYLVLPILGPSTARDGAGRVIDAFFHPLTYILDPSENLIRFGAESLVERERLLTQTDELRESSLDFYAAVRSLYLQNRAIELGRREPETTARAPPPDGSEFLWPDMDG